MSLSSDDIARQAALAPQVRPPRRGRRLFFDGWEGATVASGDDGNVPQSQPGHGPVPRADRRTVVWGFAGPEATRFVLSGPGVHRVLRPGGRRVGIPLRAARLPPWAPARDDLCRRSHMRVGLQGADRGGMYPAAGIRHALMRDALFRATK
jgi:hypothetical protein